MKDDLEEALRALRAEDTLGMATGSSGAGRFGKLATFSAAEDRSLREALAITTRYIARQEPPRPLCLAVFGPPGSGKSFAVEQIHALCKDSLCSELKLPFVTLNLTQVDGREGLAEALARIAGSKDGRTIPFVFFDEFDCRLDGAELGWLSWFLAPMHDGRFVHHGASIALERAVYIFAGGTATTFGAFANPLPERLQVFRASKGPDFVSRLRATLDVCGPNTEPRALRRAPIIAFDMAKAGIKLSDDVAKSMLGVARYRHGARSIGAIFDVCDLDAAKKSGALELKHLPQSVEILDLHVDRGPLDPARVHGDVTMSGGGKTTKDQELVWEAMAGALFRHGATVAYGGKLHQGLTAALESVLSTLPPPLAHPHPGGAHPAPRLRFTPPDYAPVDHGDLPKLTVLEPARGLTPTELASVPPGPLGEWWKKVLSLFRMRLQVAEAAIACVAVGGDAPNPTKRRMAGVAEEILLHVALGRPVYIAGGFGGSARIAGTLLGLERPWVGGATGLFPSLDDDQRAFLDNHRRQLCPPPWSTLPTDEGGVLRFFDEHALGTPQWPQNGLSERENRRLFESVNPDEVAELVVRGMLVRFADS